MALVTRFDHVGITVRDLRAVMAFFVALGLEPDGDPQPQQGRWLEDVIGIDGARVEVVTLRVPGDGPGVELQQFLAPVGGQVPQAAPPDQPGLRSIAFQVVDLDEAVHECGAKDSSSSALSGPTRTCSDSATSGAPRASS